MFRLYQHHDLEVLAGLLAALRERSRPRSPLQADTIVVPDRGTGRWLQAELAAADGCAANLDLPLPGRFVWSVLRDSLPGRPDSSDFEVERLTWHLYALLPELELPQVRRYLAGEPPEQHRYQLARQLAHVFDQYLIHRRDVLAAWQAGREADEPPASWQAPVWRALVARIGVRDRARLMTEFLDRAAAGRLDPADLPDPVYAFALVDLPVDYLRLLQALGDCIDIHFLLPNPSAVYWGDIERRRVSAATDAADEDTGHPLLASLGRSGRDFLATLYSDAFTGVHEPDLGYALASTPPTGETLLQRVQAGIIAGEAPANDGGDLDPDDSIQVHACHGPVREIQVLHDRLLHLLAREPDIHPRDILVLVTDMARYAPAIHGVFSAADGPRFIPYTVSDQPRRDTHPIAGTFQQLLALPLSRWTMSEITALAGVPAVMRCFGLDDNDLEDLRHWCSAAGVRWGLDAQDRAAAGTAGFEQNSWRFGLDRLLLGLAQQGNEILVDGVAPWSDLEGSAATPLGAVWLLLDRLRAWRDTLLREATAGAWQERLNDMVDDLFRIDTDDPGEVDALAAIHAAIAALAPAEEAAADAGLSWEAVRECLHEALAGGGQRQPMLSGGVSFAGIEALRGVPFAVIAMVGMDDGVFPRQDSQRGFNLLRREPRPGDPSVRDRDRMIFLQALMSARRCFHVSYTGRDTGDGSELQPSPVVGEWLDFLCTRHGPHADRSAVRRAWITEQALHPFSPRYFTTDEPRLFTFVGDWAQAARARAGERRSPPAFIDTRLPAPGIDQPVALADVQRFYRHPPRWFFRECMGLELADEAVAVDDEEPRELDGLQRYLLRARLFDRARRSNLAELPAEPDAVERAQGQLPPAPLGGDAHAAAARDVNALLAVHRHWQADQPATSDVDIDLELADGSRLLGTVTDVGHDECRRMRPGPLRLGHLLPWWLEYLALVAAGEPRRLRLVGVDEGIIDQRVASLSPDAAMTLLAVAIEHFREGQTRPLLFEPRVAQQYLDKLAQADRASGSRKTPAQALDSVNGWLSEGFRPPAPATDPWLTPLFDAFPQPLGADPLKASLVTLTQAVVEPMHAHLQPAEDTP